MQVPQLWLHRGTPDRPTNLPAARTLMAVGSASLVGFAVIATTVMALGGTDAFDVGVNHVAEASRSGVATQVAGLVTALGSYQVVILLTIAFAAGTLVLSRRFVEPAALLLSAPFTSSLVYLIKLAFGRARPPSALLMGEAPTDYSFPSGHTTSGTVLFVLGMFVISAQVQRPWARRLLRSMGVAVALLIGLSRVYLGYHWATDVLAGWLLAAAVVAAAVLLIIMVDRVRRADVAAEVGSTADALQTTDPRTQDVLALGSRSLLRPNGRPR